MGLDMHLTGVKHVRLSGYGSPVSGEVPISDKEARGLPPSEDGFPLKSRSLDMGYWRKHPNLHGYIVQNFAGGEDDCRPIELSEDDLERIVSAVKSDSLIETTGFFFGASDGSEKEYDIETFEKAIKWLKEKDERSYRYVTYQASW